ncbi:Ankyrin-1-like protein 2 [Colletotrichum kahawae]|uniref:Ankyrin-1-like protein 2 n=1 Tax=Colletotrichum kahawae TaxID=34407 RepID=A0AAD9Y5P2_COLKA|nr:Ankyrin-1-like protein 2 [Colletotrichum kahawae]
MVEKLVEHGADVNAPPYGDRGATCIQWAAMRGTFGIVQKLLRIGADPNAPACDLRGRTALEGAAEQGRLDILQLLLDSGVQTQGRGRRQYVRAVRFALREGHYAAAALLKSHRPWTEVDDEIASERQLLHDDQSPRAIAKRGMRVYESGYNSYDESTEDSDSDSSGDFYSDDECGSGLREDVEKFQRPPISLDEEDKGDGAECIDYTFSDGSSRSSKSFEEIDVGFLPSKIYDQVKIDLRQEQCCMEDSGNELWAEAYERFSLRKFGLPSFD